MSTRRTFVQTLLCVLGLLLVVFAALAIALDHDQRTRGVAFGFPEPIHPYFPRRPALGVNVALEQYDDAALPDDLARIQATGAGWVRQTFAWSQIEPQRGSLDWASADRLLTAVGSTSLEVIAVLDTSPSWANPTSTLHPPSSAADFAGFARQFARRYGDRIDYYQIWDEPNLGDRWNGEVNPVAYAEMLRQARDAIHAVDPHAVIILAGLAPTVETSRANMADWLFLRRLYEAGAQDAFDVASGKPYGFDTGPDDRRVDPSVLNFSHVILMREEMVAHGDAGKALWASHFGWNTHPQSIWGRATEAQQAQWTQDAVRRARDEWPWLGVMVLENWEPSLPLDDARWGFSVKGKDTLDTLAKALKPSQGFTGFIGYHPAAVPARPGSADYLPNPLAAFAGNWRFGELGADWSTTGETVSFTFNGTSLALHVRRAADRANLYITVDGRPANALPQDDRGSYLQLIPPDVRVTDIALIPVATGLGQGEHTVEIVTERGWNQWSLIGWSVGRQEDRGLFDASLALLGAAGLALAFGAIRSARRVAWGAIGRAASSATARLSDTTQVVITTAAALIFYASAWLTWGGEAASAYRRLGDPANVAITLAAAALFALSPWLILTLISGAALAILILLRLDLGLMLVAFFAPFFMLPASLFYRFSSMVELTLIMCVASWVLHRLYAWHQSRMSEVPGAQVSGVHVSRVTFYACARAAGAGVSRFTSLDKAVLAFFIVATLSLLAADYFEVALREWRIILLEPALFYALIRTSRLDRPAVWRIVDALVLAGAAVALIGLAQYAFNLNIITAEEGTRRLRSVYGSPNNVGLFLGRVFPIALACLLLGAGRRRIGYGLALLPIAAAIVLSQSRGALLIGVPAAILAIGLLAGGRWVWAALGTLAAGVLAALPFLNSPRVQSLLSGEGTQVFRIALWRSAVNMIREHPLLGVGPDNFLYAYRDRYMLPEAWQEPFLSHPHNFALDFAARLGLLGLAAFVWIQIEFWRTGYSVLRNSQTGALSIEHRALIIGLMASMADFLAHGLVDASYFVVDLAFVFMLTLALAERMKDEG